MDQLLEQARSIYEGEIDFEGQRLAEYLTYGLLSFVGALAFLVGFIKQDIYQIIYIGLGGTVLTFLAVVPPWPYFNKHPLAWLPPRSGNGSLQAFDIQVDGKKVS
ncbi:unnamed protein product [Zymoseptoria tritici ST99CH_1A5]|uniref:Signal peptidase complex subunit 1 n=4 Tax=Zymoseptoria tritici TaxID=1047171 RepID=F9XHY2_ZYMTI|nr:uncharacterized protein MYCGRDRAFT_46384 [Zymoseptoria tritici IPO323]SMQ53422.1 unnamed protein product [Zymoseptoria tritici ST99CH_3D7]SMR57001.1 unnamed protein product [Zymoseptoria tritici ST99CH_1E4]SMR59863.1 unnamed protein product [Zymoseptoria tritici ST99CH_3D1]SMY27053.1 unnamed protein product [Zymoseptoria tritici ST99CH_1A5]EGP85031.1 hypothetical protein MYCGRDRAFT_46384 [Zymoseptoria tritici IPO323]